MNFTRAISFAHLHINILHNQTETSRPPMMSLN